MPYVYFARDRLPACSSPRRNASRALTRATWAATCVVAASLAAPAWLHAQVQPAPATGAHVAEPPSIVSAPPLSDATFERAREALRQGRLADAEQAANTV